jgi:hypothetical protein
MGRPHAGSPGSRNSIEFHDDDMRNASGDTRGSVTGRRPTQSPLYRHHVFRHVRFLLNYCTTYDPPDVICPRLRPCVEVPKFVAYEFRALYQNMRPVPGLIFAGDRWKYHTEDR